MRKLLKNQNLWQESHQSDKHLSSTPSKILRTILKKYKGITQTKMTGKLMTMHMALHLRDDIDRLYVSRKEGRRYYGCITIRTWRLHQKEQKRLLQWPLTIVTITEQQENN